MYCLIIVLFSNISNIPPILHKSKSFPCLARAMPAFRMCKFCMCKFCRLGHCMGLMFQTGLSWGCFASAVWQGGFNRLHGAGLVSGSGRQTAGGGVAACRCLAWKNQTWDGRRAGKQALPRSDFQESCRLTLSNIPKRALGYLECARIAFILPVNGHVACKV